jgi:hypothetical protein
MSLVRYIYSINVFDEYANSVFGVFWVFALEVEAAGSSRASACISPDYTE